MWFWAISSGEDKMIEQFLIRVGLIFLAVSRNVLPAYTQADFILGIQFRKFMSLDIN
jgi:hypothetical protein